MKQKKRNEDTLNPDITFCFARFNQTYLKPGTCNWYMKTVTVEKKVSKTKKEDDEVDWDTVESFRRGLEDIKHGRIKKWGH